MNSIRNGTWPALAKRFLTFAALVLIPGSSIALPLLWWLNQRKVPGEGISA